VAVHITLPRLVHKGVQSETRTHGVRGFNPALCQLRYLDKGCGPVFQPMVCAHLSFAACVGTAGFEPATSRIRTEHATWLRYAP
jgi:hypothetical protein